MELYNVRTEIMMAISDIEQSIDKLCSHPSPSELATPVYELGIVRVRLKNLLEQIGGGDCAMENLDEPPDVFRDMGLSGSISLEALNNLSKKDE